MSSKQKASKDSRAGYLLRQDNLGSFAKVYGVLKARELFLYPSENRDEEPLISFDLEGAVVGVPDTSKVAKRFSMEIVGKGPSGSNSAILCAESKDEQEAWLQAMTCAAVADAWPGGLDLAKRPQPQLYSMWILEHNIGRRKAESSGGSAASTGAGASAGTSSSSSSNSGGGASNGAVPSAPVPSPFPKLPALKSSPAWQRKSLLLQKLRWCSVVFDGVDASAGTEDREYKRNTLLEVVDYADAAGRALFADVRVLEDTFTMVRGGDEMQCADSHACALEHNGVRLWGLRQRVPSLPSWLCPPLPQSRTAFPTVCILLLTRPCRALPYLPSSRFLPRRSG